MASLSSTAGVLAYHAGKFGLPDQAQCPSLAESIRAWAIGFVEKSYNASGFRCVAGANGINDFFGINSSREVMKTLLKISYPERLIILSELGVDTVDGTLVLPGSGYNPLSGYYANLIKRIVNIDESEKIIHSQEEYYNKRDIPWVGKVYKFGGEFHDESGHQELVELCSGSDDLLFILSGITYYLDDDSLDRMLGELNEYAFCSERVGMYLDFPNLEKMSGMSVKIARKAWPSLHFRNVEHVKDLLSNNGWNVEEVSTLKDYLTSRKLDEMMRSIFGNNSKVLKKGIIGADKVMWAKARLIT